MSLTRRRVVIGPDEEMTIRTSGSTVVIRPTGMGYTTLDVTVDDCVGNIKVGRMTGVDDKGVFDPVPHSNFRPTVVGEPIDLSIPTVSASDSDPFGDAPNALSEESEYYAQGQELPL